MTPGVDAPMTKRSLSSRMPISSGILLVSTIKSGRTRPDRNCTSRSVPPASTLAIPEAPARIFAAATTDRSLGLDQEGRSASRRVDVRFARELRAGASFHVLSAPIALDEAAVRLGHQFVDSGNGEVTAWVEEMLDIAPGPLPRET